VAAKWQLKVAAGQDLPLGQNEITCTGHAIEVRVYAEDPYAGFLPQAGHVLDAAWPLDARVETDLERDQDVSTAYDPMLGKIIVSGADRAEAIAAMVDALDDTGVFGVTTNTGFLHASKELLKRPSVPDDAAAAAAKLWARFSTLDGDTPFSINDGWRSGGEPAPTRVTLRDPEDRLWSFDFDEDEYVDAGALAIIGRDDISVACQGDVWHFEVPDPMRGGHRLGVSTDADVISPMPGTVLRVDVAEGDDGVVAHVGAAAGDQVPIKHLLFTVDPA